MSTSLYISASPRSQASESSRLAEVFLETYRTAYPEVTIGSSALTPAV